MNGLEISKKFKPLFKLLDPDFHPEIDTVIITGGRYSLKSFTVSIFSLISLVNYGWNTLYTRFTNMSITDSVKPEVSDKIDLLGFRSLLTDTSTHIEHKNNRISFKGIKTGSKGQTANLKSLSGFNLFVNDEAEELPDFDTFKKIFYSIRQTNKRNLSILILNPTSKRHWIFEEFFEKKGLAGGENGIVGNVMYIHSSYLDCDFDLMPKNILNDYLRLKEEQPKKYNNVVLGGWLEELEGVLISKKDLTFAPVDNIPDENVLYRFAVLDPADTGGDKYSIPFFKVVYLEGMFKVYCVDVLHNTNGIAANTERVIDRVHKYSIDCIFIEKNGIGLAAVMMLNNAKPEFCKLFPFPSTINKEVRIQSHYETIPNIFIFDSNYQKNIEYNSFISDLTSYTKDGDNKNKKDAIDVCCLAVSILKLKYKSYIYSTERGLVL
jgi:PBSX family phage terminase large subunit